jgi:hypothetical protein
VIANRVSVARHENLSGDRRRETQGMRLRFGCACAESFRRSDNHKSHSIGSRERNQTAARNRQWSFLRT